jgi:4-hydroxy-2-oxoheptanedioate aldolase
MHNPAKSKLIAGETVTAIMVTMPSVPMAQILAASGADVLIFDMEHGPMDLPTVHAMIAATRGSRATPVVRIPAVEPWLAKPVLDTGAMGINFPMVSTAEAARATVKALRYPPAGERGYAPSYAPLRWDMPAPDYLATANDALLNIITIETPEAIANLDAILAIPGIDVVAIASFDLSMSLGIPGQFDDPEFRRLVGEAEEKVRRADLPLGGVCLTPEAARARRDAGYQMLLVGFDVALVQDAARAAVVMAGSPVPLSAAR